MQAGSTRYLIAISESFEPRQTEIDFDMPMSGYDMLTGKHFDSTKTLYVDFRSLDAHIYAFPPAAIAGINAHGSTVAVAGTKLLFAGTLTSGAGTALNTIAPGTLRISDQTGHLVLERMDAIGPGCKPLVWDTASTQKPGVYGAALTELISTAAHRHFQIRIKAKAAQSRVWLAFLRTAASIRRSRGQESIGGLLGASRSRMVDRRGRCAAGQDASGPGTCRELARAGHPSHHLEPAAKCSLPGWIRTHRPGTGRPRPGHSWRRDR